MLRGDQREVEPKNPVWQAVVRYLVISVAAVVLISLLGVYLFERSGQAEAIRDAKDQTRASSKWAVEPALTDGVLSGDPEALRDLDKVIRQRVLRGSSVVRVKIWDRSGRIVYSDEPRLIGARYPIPADELKEFESTGIEAEVSDLSEPENRFERGFGKLLEVYAALQAPSGQQLRTRSTTGRASSPPARRASSGSSRSSGLGALILLALIQLPLAWQLANRVRRGQRERVDLLQRAVDASETERRRIAADLHDGVVQSLAGVSYSLSAAANDAPPDLAPVLREAAAQTREGIRELRSLLVEIYPPELHRQGLEAALGDLLAPCTSRGLKTSLRVEPEGDLPAAVQALFFRAAQEALRNVVKHADAKKCRGRGRDRRTGARRSVSPTTAAASIPSRGPTARTSACASSAISSARVGGDLDIDSTPGREHRSASRWTVIRVLLAEDHAVVRAGPRAAARDRWRHRGRRQAVDGEQAIRARGRARSPDVVLMDISMPNLDGIQATKRITEANSEVQVVVLTSFADLEKIEAALDAGAIGYLLKDAEPEDIIRGVQAAARGESPFAPRAARALLAARAERPEPASERAGARRPPLRRRGSAEQADRAQAGISEKTVKAHLTRIFQQIGVSDRTQAALWAKEHGI